MTAKTSLPRPKPPDAENCERALVGAVLSDPDRVLPIVSKRGLEVDSFTDAEARQAWGAITRLSAADNPVDAITVQSESGLPVDAIEHMIDAGLPAHCEYYADAIRDRALKRAALAEIKAADGIIALRLACERVAAGLPSEGDGGGRGFTVRSWGEVLDATPPARRYILGDLLACGQLQVLFGQGGLGKSRLATNLARNQVLGLDFLGCKTGDAPLRHLFVGSENDLHRWQIDARSMTRGLSASDRALLAQHIRVTTLENAEDVFINLGDERNVERWRATLRTWRPDVLWCDPWGDIIEGDGFDRDVRSTLATLRKLAREATPDCGIVVLAHARTGAQNVAQAVGFDAANFGKDSKALFSCARAVVNVAPYDGGDNPDLCWIPAKNNNGRRPEALRIRLDPSTLTYRTVEALDVEGWQRSVKDAARTTWQRSAVKFDADAVLGLLTAPMTKTELHAAVRGWGVTERDTRAGIDGLLRRGQLVQKSGGERNTKLVGKPESFQT